MIDAPSLVPVVHFRPWPDGGCRLVVTVVGNLALGSPRRETELRHRLSRVLKRLAAPATALVIDPAGVRIEAMCGDRPAAEALSTRIRATLAVFVQEPLYPRVVEEALAISPQERLRWTKDGRLVSTEGGEFRRGKRAFRVARYPVAGIAALAASPATIAAWRQSDRAGGGRPGSG